MPKEIENLIVGYKNFRDLYFEGQKDFFEHLVKFGQAPKVMVIACSDSRVDPAIIMNSKPGDLFVIRNVANLVPKFNVSNKQDYHGTSAALEFGVCVLNVRHIIVLGHAECGGIGSLFEKSKICNTSFIDRWMDLASYAKKKVVDDHYELSVSEQINKCAQYSISNSLKNLISFPWIRSKVESSNLYLHGWYFDLFSGALKRVILDKDGAIREENLYNMLDLKIDESCFYES